MNCKMNEMSQIDWAKGLLSKIRSQVSGKKGTSLVSYAALALLASSISTAHAVSVSPVGFFVEPYAGYGVGGGMSVITSGNSADALNFSGVGFGGRAGLHVLGIGFVGADYSYYPSLSSSFPTGVTSVTFGTAGPSLSGTGNKLSRLGAVLGANVPVIPLRAWVGYNPMEKLIDANLTLNGKSYKVGLGFTLLPLVSLNAEYIWSDYSDVDSAGTTRVVTAGTEVTSKMFLLSVSLPLSPF